MGFRMKPLHLLLLLPLGACATGGTNYASGPGAPGYTGRTQVIGNNSTIAGNAEATNLQQKWQLGPTR